MRLRSRDHEDPELNVISLVDVVLLLLIFFMLSTKFVDESRIELQLPQAVLQLKQGAGRLIRDETDRGVLMLCDPRLVGKPYGRRILASLPPIIIVVGLQRWLVHGLVAGALKE